jgi:hypothetical protein
MRAVMMLAGLLTIVLGMGGTAKADTITLAFSDGDWLAGYEAAYSLDFTNASIDTYWDPLANQRGTERSAIFPTYYKSPIGHEFSDENDV